MKDFLNGCEDVDLCIRLNRAGYDNYVVHDSVIEHVKGATTGRKDRNEENFELLMEKWGNEIRKNESVQDAFSMPVPIYSDRSLNRWGLI